MRTLFTEEQIRKRVEELGRQIANDYAGRRLFLVAVLKGAMVFCSDLMRSIGSGPEIQLETVTARSYKGQDSTGKIHVDVGFDCQGKDILIVEDIADTGQTLAKLKGMLLQSGASDVRTCVLLDKPQRRKADVSIEYTGFMVEDAFVVGYGLDIDERHRELPHIAVVTSKV